MKVKNFYIYAIVFFGELLTEMIYHVAFGMELKLLGPTPAYPWLGAIVGIAFEKIPIITIVIFLLLFLEYRAYIERANRRNPVFPIIGFINLGAWVGIFFAYLITGVAPILKYVH